MGLARLIRGWLGGRTRRPWRELRFWVPEWDPEVTTYEVERVCVLVKPLREDAGRIRTAAARRAGAKDLTYELDAVGRFVWNLLDGKRNLESLAHALEREFKMHRLEAEVSLSAFVEMLHGRGLIRVRLPKESAPRTTKTGSRR